MKVIKEILLIGVFSTMFLLPFSALGFEYPYGTYQNPIQDRPFDGDWSGPVHKGMYCVCGKWHRGWLRENEGQIVIKPSCAEAYSQMPVH